MSKSRKKPADGENGAAETVDIPHEVVDSQTQTSLTPVFETVEHQIGRELAKFNFPEAAINQLKEQFGGLTISGPDDKTGYKAVKEAWSLVRSKRTGLEKKGLELRNNFKVFTTAIGKEEDRLVDLITPLEEDLYGKWKAIDDEKERAKKEQEEAEGRRLMARIEELQTIGMAFRDGFYQIGDTITVDVASLRSMPDDTFGKLKAAVAAKADEIKKAAELERQRKDKEAAELKRQQDDLKAQQEQMAEQQRQLQAQKDEMSRQLRELRLAKLQGLGMVLDGTELIKWESVSVYIANLAEITADEFNQLLEAAAEKIKELKNQKAQAEENQRQEAAEKERREKFIAKTLEAVGMVYNWHARNFQFKTELFYTEIGWNDFAGMDDAAIVLKAQEIGEFIIKAKKDQEQADADRKKETEKAEKLAMSDKQRWEREIAQLEAQILRIVPGEYKTKAYQQKAQDLLERVTNLMTNFKR